MQADRIEQFSERKASSWLQYIGSRDGVMRLAKTALLIGAVGALIGLGASFIPAAGVSAFAGFGIGAAAGAVLGAGSSALVSLGGIIATRAGNDPRECFYVIKKDPLAKDKAVVHQVGECSPQDIIKDDLSAIQTVADNSPNVRIVGAGNRSNQGQIAQYFQERQRFEA